MSSTPLYRQNQIGVESRAVTPGKWVYLITPFIACRLCAGCIGLSGAPTPPIVGPASSSTPKISNVHVAESNTNCTVTWSTDVGSDSLADFGTGMGPWIP